LLAPELKYEEPDRSHEQEGSLAPSVAQDFDDNAIINNPAG